MFVQRRLAHRRMSFADLALQAGISKDTIYRAARLGAKMRLATLSKMDGPLAWPAGTCADVVAGGTPPPDEEYRSEHQRVRERLAGIESKLTVLTEAVERLEANYLNAS